MAKDTTMEFSGFVIDIKFLQTAASLYLTKKHNEFKKSPRDMSFPQLNKYQTLGNSHVFFTINKNDILGSLSESTTINFDSFITFVIDELNSFTKCLEWYLMYFVKGIEVSINHYIINAIKELYNKDNFINVINFNYTDTVYLACKYDELKVDICYVHGEGTAYIDNENNNLILGIDENNPTNIEPSFVAFRKYFQRFIKNANSKYYDWIMEIKKEANQTHNLYIIGHSLTPSDKQILYSLITLENVNTTIYYIKTDEIDNIYQLAQNLATILGFEKFAELTCGNDNRKITFKNLYN